MAAINYKSCIKINGHTILPPIVTEEIRIELANYKKQAIEIERRLLCQREFNLFIKDIAKSNSKIEKRSLENVLAFEPKNALTILDSNVPWKTPDTVPSTPKQSNNFTCTILDVTQYKDNVITFFDKLEKDDAGTLTASTVELNLSKLEPVEEKTDQQLHETSQDCLKPRLLRSNSYILDSPSPILLQHMSSQTVNGNVKQIEGEESVFNADELSRFSFNDSEGNTILLNLTNNDGSCTQTYSLNQNDDQREVFNIFLHDFEKKNLENVGTVALESISDESFTIDDLLFDNNTKLCDKEYSSNGYELTSPLIFLESDLHEVEGLKVDVYNDSYIPEPFTILKVYDNCQKSSNQCQEYKCRSSKKEMFSDDSIAAKKHEDWAATILTAAARGYLVRRLKRTERVRILIQTIQDALLCAVSLHTDDTDSIREADVELHRRLIQQVSAGCREFYHVFFDLTIKQQMDIIAIDRQRLQDKLKRSKSGASSSTSLKIDFHSSPAVNSSPHSSFSLGQKRTISSFAARLT